MNRPKTAESPKVVKPAAAAAAAPAAPAAPANPGVIDLTDEDDKAASKPAAPTAVKILNKQMITTPKIVPAKTIGKSLNNQKIVTMNQVKAGQVINKGEERWFIGWDNTIEDWDFRIRRFEHELFA